MRNLPVFPTIGAALAAAVLAACDAPADTQERTPEAASEDRAATAEPATPAENVADDGYPDLTPPALDPDAERGEKGARNVLLSFVRAIEMEEFDQAYAMFGESAMERMSRAEFDALFDGFGKIAVAVPGGRLGGAAGSLYYEVPTTVTGASGKALTGAIVLRRANDVPGATAEQLRWHVERVDLQPVD